MCGIGLQFERDEDATDHQNVIVLFDLAYRVGEEPAVRGIDLAGFQRASKGSAESTGGRSDQIVQRGGV